MRQQRTLGVTWVLAAWLAAGCAGREARPVGTLTPEQWREDLSVLAEELPRRHADLFFAMRRERFDRAVRSLHDRIPSLAAHQIVVELSTIVAMATDGHTELMPLQEASGFRVLPLALYQFGEDLHVIRAEERHREALGARVLRVGSVPASDAVQRVIPVLSADNQMEYLHTAPRYLVSPEILAALGIVGDVGPVPYEIETRAGRRLTIHVRPSPGSTDPELLNARTEAGASPTLAASRPDEWYWFTFLEDSRTAYFQINASQDQEGKPKLARVTRDFLAMLDAKRPERVVVDVRINSGGNVARNDALVRGLQWRPYLHQRGRLFVITGRRTFSAGFDIPLRLREVAGALLVGEPARAAPKGPGNREEFTLPWSGLKVDYSDRLDTRSVAPGKLRILPVDIAAPPTIDSHLAGRDVAMEAILALPPPAD